MVNESTVSGRHLRVYCISYCEDNKSTADIAPLVYAMDVSRNGTLLECHRGNKCTLKNERRAILLNDHDQLHVTPSRTFTFMQHRDDEVETQTQREMDAGIANTSTAQTYYPEVINASYTISDRLLGGGTYGKVFMAYSIPLQLQVACKIVDTSGKPPALLV